MLESSGYYYPEVSTGSKPVDWQGTIISLAGLRRSTKVDAETLAISLSRLFNYSDAQFAITVIDVTGKRYPVTRELRLQENDVEFSWRIPETSFGGEIDSYLADNHISGWIIASRKPLRQNMRGITLYANGRLINEPEFFGSAESSFAYSYLTGYIDVNFLDEFVPDVIASDRRAINWEVEGTADLRTRLIDLVTLIASEWRTERTKKKRERAEGNRSRSFEDWTSTVKGPEREPLQRMLATIVSPEVDIPENLQDGMIENLEMIALLLLLISSGAIYIPMSRVQRSLITKWVAIFTQSMKQSSATSPMWRSNQESAVSLHPR